MTTPSPYGPLFLRLANVAVRLSGGSVVSTIMILRLFEVAGVVLIAISLPKLAKAAGKDPARAVWLGVCNPLVLFHFIGGGHNDALMIGLIVAGLAVATVANRPLLGVLLCVVAATIKAPALLPAGFIILDAVRNAPAERRVPTFAKLSGLGGLAFVASRGRAASAGAGSARSASPAPTAPCSRPPRSSPTGSRSSSATRPQVLNLVRTAAARSRPLVGVVYLLWRAPKIGTVRACGIALALIVALGPIVLPWYVLWGLIVLAAVGRRIERGFAIFASVVLSIVVQPSGFVDARRRADGRGRRAHRRSRSRSRGGRCARGSAATSPPRSRSTAAAAASRRAPTCCARGTRRAGRRARVRRNRPRPDRARARRSLVAD